MSIVTGKRILSLRIIPSPSFDDVSLNIPRVAISKNGLIIKTVTELNE